MKHPLKCQHNSDSIFWYKSINRILRTNWSKFPLLQKSYTAFSQFSFFSTVDNFFRQKSSSTTVIDRLHTLYSVVESFFPQGIDVVDNLLKTIDYQGII